MIVKRGVAVALLVGAAVVGCGSKDRSTLDPAVEQRHNGDATQSQTPEDRSAQLAASVDQFAAARKDLRGHSDEQSRRGLADAFGKLQDVLTNLKGPDADGAFRQQIRIIETARKRLTGDTETAIEPTINAAIRAAQRALSEMASERFAEDEQAKTLMTALDARVETLNTVRGPIHGFETAKALDEIGAVAQRMADVIQQRMPPPAPAPATAPAAGA
jgi:hypothetical protein